MLLEKPFQPARVYLLIRNTILLNRSSILFIAAALAGVCILFSFFDTYGNLNLQFHRNLYLFILFPGGLLLTGKTFKELHDPVKGYSWLLLPASILEKTLSRILLTTVIYIIGSMIFYLLLSIFSEGLNRIILHRSHPLFNPFDPVILYCALTYISIQSPFLIGAVYFKKHVLSKTILSLSCAFLIFGVCILIAIWIIFGQQGSGLDLQNIFHSRENNFLSTFGPIFMNVAKILFWLVIPIISWIICFFRHKETEL
jgi:hypothetical protein